MLLQEINNEAANQIVETNHFVSNVMMIVECIVSDESNEEVISGELVVEAITNWLAKAANIATKGTIDPAKKKSVAEIMGAVTALGDKDLAGAFNDKGDLGTMLYSAGSANASDSNAALKRLREIGRHPSVKTFTQAALTKMEDPTNFGAYVQGLSQKIDQMMRTSLHREKNSRPLPISKPKTPASGGMVQPGSSVSTSPGA